MKNTIVDIVIPIYKDFEATKNCLESVLKYSDKSQRLILINDNSPEDEIVNYLKKVAESNQSVTLIEHSKNLGFVKTVNEGMNYSKDHDVILLNSDTVVTRNWVNKLKKKAYIRDNIATVTPFSNSATMFSYPISNNTNKLPNEKNPEEVNELFEKVNYSDDLIEVPTGHGFCLYITRKAIQQVGLFDAETFGKGYGEENDFCQRAKQCGFINVPAFDCFIYHKDGASFGTGSERDRMRELTMEKLLQLHPSYIHQLEEFMLEDPFRTFRALLDFELIKEDTKPKILYVGHNWGGGTQTHLMEMAMAAIKHDWIPFVLKPNGNSLYLESPAYPNFQLMFSSEDKLEELTTTLKAIGINHLHFQHLINLPNEILQLPEKLSVDYDITLHDYYLACPRINLLKNGNEYCGTNTNEKICNQCLGTADSIASWRENNLKILDGARVISTPSKACADILHKYFPKLKINVIPHPFANFSGKEKILNIGEKINVAVVGMIGEHKGMNILKTCSEYSKEKDLPINWFVIGSTIDDKTLSNVVISGNYSSREELARKLEEYKIDLVFFPSIWPETFSYVISEAWSAGLPVLSADLGAQGERIKETGAGWLVKSLEAKTVCDQILEIKNDSTLYRKALGNIKNYKPDSEIDWKGYYQGLTIEKKGKINIPKEITGIIKVASKLSNFEKYQEVINNQEKTISTLDKMYFSQTAKYEEILNSRGWTFIKYIRTIHYPKEFMSQTIYYLKKLLKKVLPKFLWNFLRSIRNYLAELKFDLSLMMIKRKLKTEGQKIVISVAMPVYDRTTELEEAIQSVLHQTFQAFELIIVTDGSPAETLAVIEKYKNHPKVRVFEYGDNTGNSVRGRNKAILEARGKYLAFLDSDDISMPTRLADTVAIFEKTGADVVYGGYEFLLDGSREIKDVTNGQKVLPQEFSMKDLQKGNYLFNSATAVRTEFVRKAGGLKNKMCYCEDYELWLRMLHLGAKFTPLKKSVIKYRLHEGNNELNFKPKEQEWIRMALKEYEDIPNLPQKIAYVLPTSGIGGGPAVVCEHANRLKARGYDVTIVIDPVYPDKYDLSWFPNQTVPVIPLEKAVTEYDLLIATGWTTAHTLKALDAKKKLYFVQSDERRFTEDRRTKERIEKTYRMDYEFMTEAKWIKKWLKEEFKKEAYLIPNAVNESIFFSDKPLEPKNKKLRVLIEGPTIIPFKGMDEAAQVLKDLDCEVWIVSSCGKPKKDWRYDRFFEGLPMTEMRRIYSSCDLILKLSRVEGFFGPPLEMMACGGTAVVGDVTGFDEYIVDGENALVVKLGDLESAKAAVNKLIHNHELLAKLKKGGLATAKNMNWEKSVDLLEEIIKKNSAYAKKD